MMTSSLSSRQEAFGAKERAQDRQIAQSRQALDLARDVVLEEARDREAFAAA